MTYDEENNPDFAALTDSHMESDALFDVLSDSRRRFVLACLQEHDTPMALENIVDELAIWEHDAEITEIPAEEVSSISISLSHVHIPKMVDGGIVKYSQERDAVTLTEDYDELTSLVSLPLVE